jgi:hypothetical protein
VNVSQLRLRSEKFDNNNNNNNNNNNRTDIIIKNTRVKHAY